MIPISETSQVSSEVKGMAAQQTNELVEKGLDPGEVRPVQFVLCVCVCEGGTVLWILSVNPVSSPLLGSYLTGRRYCEVGGGAY